MQAQFIPALTNVKDQCSEYIIWHGYSSFYNNTGNTNIRTRREVSQIFQFLETSHESKSLGPVTQPLDNSPISDTDNSPQTVSVPETQVFEDSKPIRHFLKKSMHVPNNLLKEESSQSYPSQINMMAAYLKYVT